MKKITTINWFSIDIWETARFSMQMLLLTFNVSFKYSKLFCSTSISSKVSVVAKAFFPSPPSTRWRICCTNGMTFFIYFLRMSFFPNSTEIILLSGKPLCFSNSSFNVFKMHDCHGGNDFATQIVALVGFGAVDFVSFPPFIFTCDACFSASRNEWAAVIRYSERLQSEMESLIKSMQNQFHKIIDGLTWYQAHWFRQRPAILHSKYCLCYWATTKCVRQYADKWATATAPAVEYIQKRDQHAYRPHHKVHDICHGPFAIQRNKCWKTMEISTIKLIRIQHLSNICEFSSIP